MKILPLALTATGIFGLEALLLSTGSSRSPSSIALSLVLLALSFTGFFIAGRTRHADANPEGTPHDGDTSAQGTPSVNREDAIASTAFPIAQDTPTKKECEHALDERVYVSAMPSLFASIVNYLNKTSEPMSETLVRIKTAIAQFLSGVQRSKETVDRTDCSEKLRNGISRMRSHIAEITDQTSKSYAVLSGEIERLNTHMKNILELIKGISDVAERVHVLSINASIEAARAGANGKGFKVIADEIQKLARETQSFVTTIASTVSATEETFSSLRKIMVENGKAVDREILEDSSTYADISRAMERQLAEFSELYSTVLAFIESLELDMKTLSPIAMLHAIVTQEIENLGNVTGDLLDLLKENGGDPEALRSALAVDASVERIRGRLTTSRELDALEASLGKLAIGKNLDLKRTNTGIELF